MANKFEYKVKPLSTKDFHSFEKELLEISEEGWGIVNIFETSTLTKVFGNNKLFAILKKPAVG